MQAMQACRRGLHVPHEDDNQAVRERVSEHTVIADRGKAYTLSRRSALGVAVHYCSTTVRESRRTANIPCQGGRAG